MLFERDIEGKIQYPTPEGATLIVVLGVAFGVGFIFLGAYVMSIVLPPQ